MPEQPLNVSQFRIRLLAWYDRYQRSLPWRRTSAPYKIWVSEIMLQQTRVAVVIERYREFLRRFPSLRALATSRESEVLAAWSGLGYYRRARSLRRAARVVVKEHKGKVPSQLEQLKALPGIGDYTAAAIASIAFGKPHAVVDGNVRRVLARIAGKAVTASSAWKAAQALLSPERPGDFNQAMMELGATVCLPAPKCAECPVRDFCTSKGSRARALGEKPAKRVSLRLVLPVRYKRIYLVRRPAFARIMPLMWELPAAKKMSGETIFNLKHSITNTNYSIVVSLAEKAPAASRGRWIARDRLAELPLTGLARKILRRAGILENQSLKRNLRNAGTR
jgi:A/G-specific adenine glycosylase